MTKANEALSLLESWAGTNQPSSKVQDEVEASPLSPAQKSRLWQLLNSPERPATISSQLPR